MINQSKWFTVYNSYQNNKIFCFPHAGASGLVFKKLGELMSQQYSIYALNLPGRLHRLKETPIKNMPDMLSILKDVFKNMSLKNSIFLGHSLGAIIAFELFYALQQDKQQELPKYLFISSCLPPNYLVNAVKTSSLSDEQFLDFISKKYSSHYPIPNGAKKYILPALRADFNILEQYECQIKKIINAPLFISSGQEDKNCPKNLLVSWKNFTQKKCYIKLFRGDHFFLHQQVNSFIKYMYKILNDKEKIKH